MFSPLGIIISIVGILWLSALTFFLMRTITHYNKLTGGDENTSLQHVLESLLSEHKALRKEVALLSDRYATIEKDSQYHIQKIGLLRFNPFKDTGGDQSFILALVDTHDTGVVISGLYSRSGTRWYAKKVVKGKGIEHELSEDEMKALKQAKKTTS